MIANLNGWALSGPRSRVLHAIPMPTDLGDHGRAMCGKRPNNRTGWQELDQAAPARRCAGCTGAVTA